MRESGWASCCGQGAKQIGVLMKLLSYNIRGLGSRIKKEEIRELVRRHNFAFCCIQESKLEHCDDLICRALWGNGNFGWIARDAVGRSGGIISIWNSDLFSCLSAWHMEGAIIVNGLWGSNRIQCCVINVYAPCDLSVKRDLWDRLGCIVSQYSDSCLCIAGDFNAVRRASERAGRGSAVNRREISEFDNL